ncbi:PREDICTED: uncharacterized protein LOC105360193 [Ceratosolen solmsi marchali]|uniref:Uncharacterized protein LOC105360193 n=1 Tax=Ceratosolen solmsi marchali TaxID=326594 RepID=A0AAJ6VM86_9HYME|nr:PREDICTED: uncharacterized protein LOC105360193 [Ceratosolen solmsi marchali]
MSRRLPKFEALVVNAIRRLQTSQGSTASEIANYLHQEYDVSGPEIRRQIQQTIRRGVNFGILEKSKRGYTTCDHNITEQQESQDLNDCYNCRRNARRRQTRKQGYPRSKRSQSRRRSHARRSKKLRRKRKASMSPRKQYSTSNSVKSKKMSDQDDGPHRRQPTNNSNQSSSNSKSQIYNSDDKRET